MPRPTLQLELLPHDRSTSTESLSPETAARIDALVYRRDDCPICTELSREWCAECPPTGASPVEVERELEFARLCAKDSYLRMMVDLEKDGGVRPLAA